jgi:hypothetical protein
MVMLLALIIGGKLRRYGIFGFFVMIAFAALAQCFGVHLCRSGKT